VKIKGNEKYEFYSIQLQCHVLLIQLKATQPNPSHVLENATQPNPIHGWTQPMSISAMVHCSLRPRPAGTPCMMDSSASTGSSGVSCARRRSDVPLCSGINIAPCNGPLCANMTSSIKLEVQAAGGRPSHCHGQHARKLR